MITGAPRWSLKLTHEHTGLSVDVNSNHFRTQQEAKAAGLKLLKSRLYAQNLLEVGDEILTSYILPDNTYWPEDLQNYKEQTK